jgi:hypothetical protein
MGYAPLGPLTWSMRGAVEKKVRSWSADEDPPADEPVDALDEAWDDEDAPRPASDRADA